MRVAILGPLRVEDGAGRPVEVGGARLRALLERLALDGGRPVGVPALVEALWGDSPPADELNALQSLVSRLRRALPDPTLVDSGPAGYRLAVRPDDVDAVLFERLATAGRRALTDGDPDRAASTLREALALWRGPALADSDGQPWATTAATRLEERRLTATEDRIEAELALGASAAVLPELEALAAEHPLRERLQGQLVRTLYAAGRQADALAAYEEVRRLLADELGVDPSPALREVHLQVLRADPALGGGDPTGPTNLPASFTSFLGRDDDVRRLADLVADHRLVTLIGPGGAGKTRLAVETGDRLRRRFPDGVWLVELAAVTNDADVPPAVLTAVEPVGGADPPPAASPTAPQQNAMGRLVDALRDRRALVVLDNCEHLVDAVARTAGTLLARCPELKVLATSREPLAITGEALAPVPPLGLPEETATPAEALACPAVALFADRAAAASPGFAVDDGSVRLVVEVCRRLDGLPLAIELAAARLRGLPLDVLAARLDDRFRLLTGGSRTALPRHQTLRAVVAWSWDLLSAEEARLADRLSVFPGGVTPAAAAAVCGEDVADLLTALVDKSLLQQVPGTGPRYRMLETLREFGTERLATHGDLAAARAAHAAFFLALAEEAEPHLRRPEQVEWLPVLAADAGNFGAALRFAIDTGDADTANRLGSALAWYWTIRGDHTSAARWLPAAAELPGPAPENARATCLIVGGISAAAVGEDFTAMAAVAERAAAMDTSRWRTDPLLRLFEPMLEMLSGRTEEALRLLVGRELSADPWARATEIFLAAMLYENEGRHAEHRDTIKQAVEAYRETGDRWGTSNALASMGNLLLAEGDLEGSMAAYGEARGLMAEIRATEDASFTRTRLATAYVRAGDLPRAKAELAAARAEIESVRGSRFGIAVIDVAEADLARREGDRDRARRLAEGARRHVDRVVGGPEQAKAMVFALLAGLDAEDGEFDRAWEQLHAAARMPGAVRDMPVMGALALASAYVAMLGGEPERSARLLGAAYALRGTEERGAPEVIELRTGLTAALGAQELDRLFAEGAALPREQAVHLLAGTAPDRTQSGTASDAAGDGTAPSPAGDGTTRGRTRAGAAPAAGDGAAAGGAGA